MKKKVFFVFIAIAIAMSTNAQGWANYGNNLFNTNTGNVGIGTTNPTTKLNIKDSSSVGGTTIKVEGFTPNQPAGTKKSSANFMLVNNASGRIFFNTMRKNGSTEEILQSVYDPSVNTWKEFTYFNVEEQRYEMRSGVVDLFLKNTGITSIGSGGGCVGIGITNPTNKFQIGPSVYSGFDFALGNNTTSLVCKIYDSHVDFKTDYNKVVTFNAHAGGRRFGVGPGSHTGTHTFNVRGTAYVSDTAQFDGVVLIGDPYTAIYHEYMCYVVGGSKFVDYPPEIPAPTKQEHAVNKGYLDSIVGTIVETYEKKLKELEKIILLSQDKSSPNTNEANEGVKIFPNPSNGKVTATSSFGEVMDISIYDMSGNKVEHQDGSSVNVSRLVPGTYVAVPKILIKK